MSQNKEVLIFTPIGRIRWLVAPDSLDEISYHLSKTFKAHPDSISLINTADKTELSSYYYYQALSDNSDIVLELKIDDNLKEKNTNEYTPLLETKTSEKTVSKQENSIREPQKIDVEAVELLDFPLKQDKLIENAKLISDTRRENAEKLKAQKQERLRAAEIEEITKEALKIMRKQGYNDKNECILALKKANYRLKDALDILRKKY